MANEITTTTMNDVTNSALVEPVIIMALSEQAGITIRAVRIDSGDLIALSRRDDPVWKETLVPFDFHIKHGEAKTLAADPKVRAAYLGETTSG